MRVFTPPVSTGSRMYGPHRLWRFMHRVDEGLTVYRTQDGAYVQTSYPSADALASATAVYLGGHVTPITDAQEVSLTIAGYGAYISTAPDPIVNVPMPYPERPLPTDSPIPPQIAVVTWGQIFAFPWAATRTWGDLLAPDRRTHAAWGDINADTWATADSGTWGFISDF